MPILKKFLFFSIIISIFFIAPSVSGETLKPVLNSRGKAPSVQIIDGPHIALKTWQEKKFKKKKVIFLGAGLGISPFSDEYSNAVLKDMGEGKWERLLEKDYPTSKFYPVGPSSYLYLAWKTGMIDKIYWVPPTKENIGEGTIGDPLKFLTSLGFNEEMIKEPRATKTSIEARLNSVPIYICNLKDLPKITDSCILIIDLSFFPPFYQDEVKTPFLDWFGGFLNIIGTRSPRVSDVYISTSTGNGDVPLEWRFIAGYLDTYFRSPSKIKGGPLPEWEFRSRGMYYDTFFQTEERLDNLKESVKHSPDDASLQFDLARAYLSMKDLVGVREHLKRAVALDKGYNLQYIEMGRYFTEKEMYEDAEVFLKEAEKTCPEDPRIYEAYNKLYSAWEKFPESAKALEKELSMGFESMELYSSLAESLRRAGEYEKARDCYNKALSYIPQADMGSRASLLLGLADIFLSQGKPEEAINIYEEALKGMPEGHAKDQVAEKLEDVKNLWEPFLKPAL